MLFTPLLKCRKFCRSIRLDLQGFVTIEVEKWLFETVLVMGVLDKWVTELVFFLRRWFCKH